MSEINQLINSMSRIEQYLDRQLNFNTPQANPMPNPLDVKNDSKFRTIYSCDIDGKTLIKYHNDIIYLYNIKTHVLKLLNKSHNVIKTIDLDSCLKTTQPAYYIYASTHEPISMCADDVLISIRNQCAIELIDHTKLDLFAVLPYSSDYKHNNTRYLDYQQYKITANGRYMSITDATGIIYTYKSVTKSDDLYVKKIEIANNNVYYLNNNYEFVIYSFTENKQIYIMPIVFDFCIVNDTIYITNYFTLQLIKFI